MLFMDPRRESLKWRSRRRSWASRGACRLNRALVSTISPRAPENQKKNFSSVFSPLYGSAYVKAERFLATLVRFALESSPPIAESNSQHLFQTTLLLQNL